MSVPPDAADTAGTAGSPDGAAEGAVARAGQPVVLAETLEAVARGFGIDVRVAVARLEDGSASAEIVGDDSEALVGREGQVIDAIQYLAAQIVSRAEGGRRRVSVDAGGYRARRAEALTRLAERAAADALEYREEIELDAMTPHDRRIVHMALQGRTDVVTRSEGEEPRRRIIVEPGE